MSAPRPPPPSAPPPSPLNINIGILGHVDSGKTSLSKILSSTFSTASLDRSRESKERGITLDLGFSSFTVPTTRLAPPLHDHIIKALPTPAPPDLQYTIVDHPGHSTLLRTIILGHHIIDTSILVIDSIGGVQPQTVEACVLGDIILANNESKGLIIVNKIDLLVEGTEGPRYQNLLTSIAELTKGTRFASSPIVPFSVHLNAAAAPPPPDFGVTTAVLIDQIIAAAHVPVRPANRPFYFMIDHCFQIKGQGTIVTGTVLSGEAKINEVIELPLLGKGFTKKIKSMQKFHSPTKSIASGDRAGICLPQLDSTSIERSIACSPSSLVTVKTALVAVTLIERFSGVTPKSGTKFHVSIGNSTTVATVTFFGAHEIAEKTFPAPGGQEMLPSVEGGFLLQPTFLAGPNIPTTQYALLTFDSSIFTTPGAIFIGSNLTEEGLQCRLAFHGSLLSTHDGKTGVPLGVLAPKFYTYKSKTCTVSKVGDEYVRESDQEKVPFEVICKGLFGEGASMASFAGLKLFNGGVSTEVGVISGAFGSEGQFRVEFPGGTSLAAGGVAVLKFKKFRGDSTNKMVQDFLDVSKSVNKRAIQKEGLAPKPSSAAKKKEKKAIEGVVEKCKEGNVYIVAGLFKPEEDIKAFVAAGEGVLVVMGGGEEGEIVAAFGKAGKCKVESVAGLADGSKVTLNRG